MQNIIISAAKNAGTCANTGQNFAVGDLVLYHTKTKKYYLITELKNILCKK